MLTSALFVIIAYLLGSISSAILLSRIMGFQDPRSEGSKNPGATNVLRIAGKKAAFLTLVGDALKGFLPVLVAVLTAQPPWLAALAGFAAFVGHCFPIFFGFKGGKGVATALAAVFAFDWIVGIATGALWLIIARVFRISSLAAIISFIALPGFIYWQSQDLAVSLIFASISVILIWRHRSNIQRLLSGTEN